MTAQANNFPKKLMINPYYAVGLVLLLVIVFAIGYVWLQTDQQIAPPWLRIMDGLWRLFFFWK